MIGGASEPELEHYDQESIVEREKEDLPVGNFESFPVECRDMYPRTGWHDVHCCVTGISARDVAAHFVQRWHHHRLSVSSYKSDQLPYVVTKTRWGICARCKVRHLPEHIEMCPHCQHYLGPPSWQRGQG